MSLVDLHLHLLPGIDDGPADVTAALRHAHRLAANGVHDAVVTPHVGHPDFPVIVSEIPRRTTWLQRALDEAAIALRVRPGGEIHPHAAGRLSRSALEVVAQGPPRARWVLLETPFGTIDEHFTACARRLREMGFGCLVAHPERATGGHARLPELVAGGAVLQVSACSLLGAHGRAARERALTLVRDGSAYVVASDGHGGTRAHTLRDGYEALLIAGVTPERAARLTCANPRFLLDHGIPASLSERVASPSAFA